MVQAEILSPDALRASDRATWRSLATGPFASPLLQPEFADLAASVRDDVRVAVFRKGQNTPGFLAFHLRPGRMARSLAAPFGDVQALVCAPDFFATGEEALKAAGIRAFQFDNLVDPFGLFATKSGDASEAYTIAPGPDAAAFLESQRALHPKRFKNHRRLGHQLERECGPVSLVLADRDETALATLLGWKQAQYRASGRHDVLAAPWVQGFMRQTHARQDGPLQGLLFSLRAKGEIIAGLFGVRSDTVFNPWIAAYDPAYRTWSPGQQVLHELVAAMPELGLERCDIGADHDHYKKYYAADTMPVHSALIAAPGRDARITRARAIVWEAADLTPVGNITSRIRRRLNQISAVELDTAHRISGLVRAFTHRAEPIAGPSS